MTDWLLCTGKPMKSSYIYFKSTMKKKTDPECISQYGFFSSFLSFAPLTRRIYANVENVLKNWNYI